MLTSRLLFYVLAASALTILVVMNVWTVPRIEAEAEGVRIFDNRPMGYSIAEAQEFLGALSQRGKEMYLGIQKYLDTLFPILFAIAMPWGLWLLTPNWHKAARIGLCLIAFLGPMCDLMENTSVRVLLHAGPENITEAMVKTASNWSVRKWTLDLIASASFILLLWHTLLQRYQVRK